MWRYVILLLLLAPTTSFSQGFINKNKKQVIKMLEKYEAGAEFTTHEITETDSTVQLLIKDAAGKSTTFIYRFDKENRCHTEEIKASCDSCNKKYLQGVLDKKKYHWRKINENQYISGYKDQLMIELPPESNDFSYMILRTSWTKQLYEMLKN
jgi:hypothetical protein